MNKKNIIIQFSIGHCPYELYLVLFSFFAFSFGYDFFRHRISLDEFNGRCSLVISNCKKDDAGDYTCTAINFAGEANSTATLLPAEGTD